MPAAFVATVALLYAPFLGIGARVFMRTLRELCA